MKNKHILFIPVALASLALVGCSSGSKRVVDLNLNYVTASSVPVNTTDHNSQAQLAEAANSVDGSLQNLSAIQAAAHPHARIAPPVNARRIGMARVASISWTGPIGPLVKRIARNSGYRFRVLGSRPAIPVMISLNARNQTLAEMLRNVKYQAQGKAVIAVYPNVRVIELRYLNV